MKYGLGSRRGVLVWQLAFLLLSTFWLWAPYLNRAVSSRTSLISQYEASGQPHALLFRLGDIAGGLLLAAMAWVFIRMYQKKLAGAMLMIIGLGMAIDSLIPTTCHVRGSACEEYISLPFVIHAVETVVTASTIFVIGLYDSWLRKRLVSIAFVAFQILYTALFLTQIADHNHFNTISQYVYQAGVVIWLAWFGRDFILPEIRKPKRAKFIRSIVASWTFINGILAITVSLAHVHFLGVVYGLYLVGNHAWLAQNGVVVGVIMLYLSRHVLRGELRARQILLWVVGLEVLQYSVLTPNPTLLLSYSGIFGALFILRDFFDRGLVPLTLKIRIKDVLVVSGGLIAAGAAALVLLHRNPRLAALASDSIDHFFDYTVTSDVPSSHTRSALLAHTMSAFILAAIGIILWILFRPVRHHIAEDPTDYSKVQQLITTYSQTPEDYFKFWPHRLQYFWGADKSGFIVYKIVGPIAFALADPITPPDQRTTLLHEFVAWSRAKRLRACFLAIYPTSKELYKQLDLSQMKIGASALIEPQEFLRKTARDKWWRWQQNRAARSGYVYKLSLPPHSAQLIQELRAVSDQWLTIGGHQEHSFGLGYFDEHYVQSCTIHYLVDDQGTIQAFTNELPAFKRYDTATVDLLRYLPGSNNAMQFLLLRTIEYASLQGYHHFDLGFVPFAASEGPLLALARTLGGGRFSAKGLEQFKNKFNPVWQPVYMAYDGDLADLALITAYLEKAMAKKD